MSLAETHLRSPSLLDRNIHCSSWSCLPYLLPTGSVSITCCSARPTRPVPPVTRQTVRLAGRWPLTFSCALSPFVCASGILDIGSTQAEHLSRDFQFERVATGNLKSKKALSSFFLGFSPSSKPSNHTDITLSSYKYTVPSINFLKHSAS